MKTSTQITFRHMPVSPAVEARIHEEVSALEQCYSRITSCHVVIEAPHLHHQRGRGFHIHIDLRVPGSEIIVNREPSLHGTVAKSDQATWAKHLETQPEHKDIYVSLRDAFASARRQLEDHAHILRGDVKHHTAVAP